MVARVVALNQPVKIDYNHQIRFKQEVAPAAGFVQATPARFRWDDKTGGLGQAGLEPAGAQAPEKQ